jgi:hypothetical protein
MIGSMTDADAGGRTKVLRVVGEVVRREIAGETILVPIRGRAADMRRMYSLNPTAAFVWERLDGRRTLGEIVGELLAVFAADPAAAQADVEAFVATALAEGLLEEAP